MQLIIVCIYNVKLKLKLNLNMIKVASDTSAIVFLECPFLRQQTTEIGKKTNKSRLQ